MKQLTILRKSTRAIDEKTRKNMIDEKKAELAYATTKHKKFALASSIAEAEVALARDGAMRALSEEIRTGVVNDPRADSWDTNSEDVTSIESDDATKDVQETVGSFVQKFVLGLWCGDNMGDGESTTMSGENMGDGESTLMTGETSHLLGSTSQRGASQDELMTGETSHSSGSTSQRGARSGENMGDGESTLMTSETSHSSCSTSQRGASQDEDY
jgi:hypothetical protein